jgi:hypothetical protein
LIAKAELYRLGSLLLSGHAYVTQLQGHPSVLVLNAAVLPLPTCQTPAAADTPVVLTLTVTNAGNVKVVGVGVTSAVGLVCQADGAAFDLAVGASNVCRYGIAHRTC